MADHRGELRISGEQQVDLLAGDVPHAPVVHRRRPAGPQRLGHVRVRFGEQARPPEPLLQQLRVAVRRPVVGPELDEVAPGLEIELEQHPQVLEDLAVREVAHAPAECEESQLVGGVLAPVVVESDHREHRVGDAGRFGQTVERGDRRPMEQGPSIQRVCLSSDGHPRTR